MSPIRSFLCVCVLASLGVTARAAPFAYVPNEGSASLSVIDTATDQVVAEIPNPALADEAPRYDRPHNTKPFRKAPLEAPAIPPSIACPSSDSRKASVWPLSEMPQ